MVAEVAVVVPAVVMVVVVGVAGVDAVEEPTKSPTRRLLLPGSESGASVPCKPERSMVAEVAVAVPAAIVAEVVMSCLYKHGFRNPGLQQEHVRTSNGAGHATEGERGGTTAHHNDIPLPAPLARRKWDTTPGGSTPGTVVALNVLVVAVLLGATTSTALTTSGGRRCCCRHIQLRRVHAAGAGCGGVIDSFC